MRISDWSSDVCSSDPEGYLAIAPDIFWRFAPGVELNPDVEAEFQKALGYFGQYDADLGGKDIEASVRWLRGQGTNRNGCVGFCLDRKSTRLNSSHYCATRMTSCACHKKTKTKTK